MLRIVWKYDDFRGDQARIVGSVIAGRETLAVVATGGGKSICYQVPGIVRGGVTLVISPLVGLIQDQVTQLLERGVPAVPLVGRAFPADYGCLAEMAEREQYLFVYSAPERLQSRQFRAFLEVADIRTVAVDEAHCISQWGHDFRPDYRRISAIRKFAPRAVFVAVTATAVPRVRRDIRRNLALRSPRVIVGDFDRPNIILSVFRVDDARRRLLDVLAAVPGACIVYDATRTGAELWAERLRAAQSSALSYHGGMSAGEREAAQQRWLRGGVRTMVATNAFGMGIDRPDVRTVVHVGLPDSMEAYYQEAGRAGRDGRLAHAVLLVTPESIRTRMEMSGKRSGVGAILRYALSMDCRRKRLVGWFSQRMAQRCGRCDVCLGRHRFPGRIPPTEPLLRDMAERAINGASVEELQALGGVPAYRNRERILHLVRSGEATFSDLTATAMSKTVRLS